MLIGPSDVALVHDCQHSRLPMAVVGHEVGRDAALVQRDEVDSRVVLLSAVEGLVELLVWVQALKENQSRFRSKQTTITHRLWEYQVETSRPERI
jgi:hypothetical protein